MLKLMRGIPFAAVATGLIVSFFLPNIVAGVADSGKLDTVTVIEAQSVSFNNDPEFSMPERIALNASSKTEVLALSTGQSMGEEAAEARAIRELSRFLRGGPFVFDADECTADNNSVSFVVDSDDPSANMIIWEFTLTDRYENEMIITIDDETGVILKLIYRQGKTPAILGNPAMQTDQQDIDYNSLASRLCEMMSAYYGIDISFGDFTRGKNLAYYRADMHGAGPVIPMYGVVRSTGFTMNEKH